MKTPLAPPPPRALLDPNGNVSDRFYTWLRSVQSGISSASKSIETIAGQADGDTFSISYPENKDYNVLINAPYGFMISSITSKCDSGTATATFKIGGTPLGGSANSVSSSAQTVNHASANVVAAGGGVICTISATSSCEGAIFMISYART